VDNTEEKAARKAKIKSDVIEGELKLRDGTEGLEGVIEDHEPEMMRISSHVIDNVLEKDEEHVRYEDEPSRPTTAEHNAISDNT
jgi:hypothetical protein